MSDLGDRWRRGVRHFSAYCACMVREMDCGCMITMMILLSVLLLASLSFVFSLLRYK